MLIRAFLAVEISEEARAGIARLRDPLEKGAMFTGAQPAWVAVESMHLTIKFLGSMEETMVERIAGRLEPACARIAPFAFGVRGIGAFPSINRPRVFWVGIKRADQELQALHRAVEGAIASLGFAPDQREFRPHLTLARLKSSRGAEAMMEIAARHGRDWCGESRADRLVLFRSDLHPEGAVHTALRTFPFAKEAAAPDSKAKEKG